MMHVEEGESQLGIPVREIKGIGEKTEKLLAKLDIETVDQLVHHYPRCYTTYPEPISISEIKTGQRCSIEAEIASPIHLKTVRKLKLCTGLIADVSGQLFVRSCVPVFVALEIFLQPVSLAAFTVPGLSNISFVFPNVSIIP